MEEDDLLRRRPDRQLILAPEAVCRLKSHYIRLSTIESHPTSIEILRNGERDILCMGRSEAMP